MRFIYYVHSKTIMIGFFRKIVILSVFITAFLGFLFSGRVFAQTESPTPTPETSPLTSLTPAPSPSFTPGPAPAPAPSSSSMQTLQVVFSLAGKVSDGAGTSIAGATVNIYNPGTTTDVVAPVTTDNSGGYSVSVSGGTYDIKVTPPIGSNFGSAIAFSHTVSSDTILNFILVNAGSSSLSGHLYDGQGNPVAGQTVSLYATSGQLVAQGGTDSQGFYSVGAQDGTYNVSFSGSFSSTNVQFGFNNYPLLQNTTLDLTLPLKKVIVHVQDAAGNPLNGVDVSTYFQGQVNGLPIGGGITNAHGVTSAEGYTDSSGNTILWLFPTLSSGSYRITASPYNVILSGVSITSDTSLTIVIHQSVSLSGHLYDGQGNPVAGQTVSLYATSGQLVAQGGTDSQGFYSVGAQDGTYNVSFSGSFSSTNVQFGFNNYPLLQNTTLDLTLPLKKVIVHVQDAAGNPLNGVDVSTYFQGQVNGLPIGGGITNAHGVTSAEGYTDSSGNTILWLFPTLSSGSYRITASPLQGPYSSYILNNVSVISDQTEVISLQFNHNVPVTTALLSPNSDNQGNYSDPTTVTLSATAASGYTVANTYYTIDGGAKQTYTVPFTVSEEGSHTITYWSIDNVGVFEAPNIKTFTIANHPPVVGVITAPANPTPVNTVITASSSFTDPDTRDTHIATWNWGDGTVSNATVTESNGSGTVGGDTHTYTQAGVYTIALTVTDDDGVSSSSQFQYVVIYDPSAGFITASGKYNSLAGWDLQNTQASGEVKFGINAKYHQNNTTPDGKAKLNFKAGNIDFNSISYQWLVVNGAKGYLMGNGTVNGAGNYTIFISVIDGSQSGGQDLIRIRITDTSTQNIIYDTQPGQSEVADPITTISNGSIKIH